MMLVLATMYPEHGASQIQKQRSHDFDLSSTFPPAENPSSLQYDLELVSHFVWFEDVG